MARTKPLDLYSTIVKYIVQCRSRSTKEPYLRLSPYFIYKGNHTACLSFASSAASAASGRSVYGGTEELAVRGVVYFFYN